MKREHFPEGKNRATAKNIQEKGPSNFTTGEKNTEEHKGEGEDKPKINCI